MEDCESKREVFVKEKERRPSKIVELANPKIYELASKVGNNFLLEKSEKQFIKDVSEISDIQDALIKYFFPDSKSWESVIDKDRLSSDFERKVSKINYPIPNESSDNVDVFEKPEEPLKLTWQFCGESDFAEVKNKFGLSGLLSLRYVQNSAINNLTQIYNHFLSLQGVGPHASNLYPEDQRPIQRLQYQALNEIISNLPPKPETTLNIDNLKSSSEFEEKLNQIAESNFNFSVFQDEKDQTGDTIYRIVSTFTIDPQTGMKFVVNTPFRCQQNEAKKHGRMSIQVIDNNGKSYFFGNSSTNPKYGIYPEDNRPFILHKDNFARNIWQSYCRSVCDVEATKKYFSKEGEWRYKVDKIYFGQQLSEIEKYKKFVDMFKFYKLIEGAKTSDFYKMRLGMFPNNESNIEEATYNSLAQIKTLTRGYSTNQYLSQLSTSNETNSINFNYPYGEDCSMYPDDFGLAMQIIIEKNSIFIRDAYDSDLGLARTKYLKVKFDKGNQWRIERGMVTNLNDAYICEKNETKNKLNEFDAQTVISALNLLSADKKERNPDSLLKHPKVNDEIVRDATLRILKNLGLTWEDLDRKKILDVGAGNAELARAAKQIESTADIFSIDENAPDSWSSMPADLREKSTIASAEELPFPDDSFDLIVNNGSIKPYEIKDEIRVLKPGGEIRVAPIGSLASEICAISYYLEKYKNWLPEDIKKVTSDLEKKVIESESNGDGFLPSKFTELRDAAFEALTQGEKNDLIRLLVEKYSEMLGEPLSYKVLNPDDFEPRGYVLYQKPLSEIYKKLTKPYIPSA